MAGEPTNGVTARNRKWRLIVGMELLYAAMTWGLLMMIGTLRWKGYLGPAQFPDLFEFVVGWWFVSASGAAGWYMGANVVQKWSPTLANEKAPLAAPSAQP